MKLISSPFSLLQVSQEDMAKYNLLAQQQAKKLFPALNMSKFYAAENADPLVFCHFAENIQDHVYDQVQLIMGVSGERTINMAKSTNGIHEIAL